MNFRYINIVLFVFFCTASPAYAYSDPGSGLMLFQLLGAAAVGCLFYVKKVRDWIVFKLWKHKNNDKKD